MPVAAVAACLAHLDMMVAHSWHLQHPNQAVWYWDCMQREIFWTDVYILSCFSLMTTSPHPILPQPAEAYRYSSSTGSVGGDSASMPATPGRRGSWRKIKSICEGLLNRGNSSGRQQQSSRDTSPSPPGGDDSVYEHRRTS